MTRARVTAGREANTGPQAITTAKPHYVLVTGASSGIGEAFARHGAAQGCDLGLCARRKDRLHALAARLRADHGVAVDIFCADLSLPGAGLALVQCVKDAGRDPDMLINNAGFSIAGGFASTDYEAQRAFMELTITTPVALTHALLPAMLDNGYGRIINISSITALTPGGKGHTLYPGAKAFLLKFSQSLSAEVRARGVHVTAVLPAMVHTEFQQANGMAETMQGAPMRFAQTPMEIVHESWRRNADGAEIVVPGLAPKCAAAMLRYLPETLVRTFTRKAAEKYYVGD